MSQNGVAAIRCKVTVWELPNMPGVDHQYTAPPGCEIEHAKAVLFQNEVRPGAQVEYSVEVLVDPGFGTWKTLRERASRSVR